MTIAPMASDVCVVHIQHSAVIGQLNSSPICSLARNWKQIKTQIEFIFLYFIAKMCFGLYNLITTNI